MVGFGLITLVFGYTTIANIFERPEGIRIASFFVLAIVTTSIVSRALRSTELRVTQVRMDRTARGLVDEVAVGEIHLIANEPDARDEAEYREKEREARHANHLPADEPVLFLEVTVKDPSEFRSLLHVVGEERHGYRILRADSSAVPNAIAALLLHLRDRTGKLPHAYFNWTEGNPVVNLLRYLFLGHGEEAPITREVLREAEPDPRRRPFVHVS